MEKLILTGFVVTWAVLTVQILGIGLLFWTVLRDTVYVRKVLDRIWDMLPKYVAEIKTGNDKIWVKISEMYNRGWLQHPKQPKTVKSRNKYRHE